MTRRILFGVTLLAMLGAAGADDKPAKDARFEKLKTLVGEWVKADKDGKPTDEVLTVFKLTGGGTALQETIHPNSPMEMVSVYHMDGTDLVLTHYCMLGNQPRMKADAKSTDKEIAFKFDGGTNLKPEKDMHIHEGSIKWIDADTIEWSWQAYMDGKPNDGHKITEKLVRKKK
jgi:hypothetical protein